MMAIGRTLYVLFGRAADGRFRKVEYRYAGEFTG